VAKKLDLISPLKYLYLIFLLGVVLALGQYFFQSKEPFLQVLLIQVLTKFTIGFPLTIIIFNKHLFQRAGHKLAEIALLLLFFALLAILASELENVFRYLIGNRSSYAPFSTMKTHLANAIITLVLGFVFYYAPGALQMPVMDPDKLNSSKEPPSRLERIPVRHKKETLLVELDSVLYIEAYDNYAFVFRTNGEKSLCNYSLGYLESVMDQSFIRIHRKHMVNREKIHSIAKHTHNRYKIRLNDKRTELVSSAAYSEKIRELVEI